MPFHWRDTGGTYSEKVQDVPSASLLVTGSWGPDLPRTLGTLLL